MNTDFLLTKDFQKVVTISKIVAAIALVVIAYLFYSEIEVVKFLNMDACKYCMEKIGGVCLPPVEVKP